MSSIASISHRNVFGLKQDVKNNISFIDEQTILYPAGANVILYNIENKAQKFIHTSEKSLGITCLAISGNRRFCQRLAKKVTNLFALVKNIIISVYDLQTMRKRKVLTISEVESKEFISISFSNDAKFLLTQTGAPEWSLTLWSWEKNKILSSVRSASDKILHPSQPSLGVIIHQISINPNDPTQICATGYGIFKLYRYTEGNFKLLPTPKLDRNILCHCWTIEDRIILGTEEGKVIAVENSGEIKWEYSLSSNQKPKVVHSVAAYSKGFVAGCSGGSIFVFERADEISNGTHARIMVEQSAAKDLYKKHREYHITDDNGKILNTAISLNEDIAIFSSDNCQIYSCQLANAEAKNEDIKLEPYTAPSHHGQITGMDTCIRIPLVVTCSSDRSVRVWNYLEGNSELVKYFSDEAHSVAIHPSGLYILVGFTDKLRLMNLLIDDIRPFREFTIRSCRECRFSNGGQYFAAVHANTVQIYSTWTFENLGNLKGHNAKVRAIHWTPDDSRIITAGVDGAIYDWALKDMSGYGGQGIKREMESVLKSCAYSSACVSTDSRTIYAVGNDKTLKEIVDGQILRELPFECVPTQVLLSHSGKMMFIGTSNGSVLSMKFPFGTDAGVNTEHQAHSSQVTRLRISCDDQFLFSASDDGCLFIFKISDREGRSTKREREAIYADEILVTKSDLEEKNSMMAELKTRVEELKMENEYQLRLKDMNFNEKIKEVTEKFMQEIDTLKITSTVLRTDKGKEEMRHEEEMVQEKERHAKEYHELESSQNSRLMAEYEKYAELQTRTTQLQQQWETQMKDLKISKENALEDLTKHFEIRLKEKQTEIDQMQLEIKRQLAEFDETTKETEIDADAEVVELKHRYEKKLKEEKEIVHRLKGENGIMRKKFNTLQGEIDSHKTEISKMYNEEKKLHSVIKSLEKDISGLRKEIQERDETIQDKEKRIYDLKKKNQELEKFKFVLDYKIKELKKQIEPRELDIQGMTSQISDMDVELENYHRTTSDLDLAIIELRLKLKAAEKEVEKERKLVNSGIAFVRRFKIDLADTVQHLQDGKKLKTSLKKLFQKYCKESGTQDDGAMEVDIQQEYARQREYLERTISSLRRKVTKDQTLHRSDNVRIMMENVTLIKEINNLRRDITYVKQKERSAEVALNLSVSRPSSGTPLPPVHASSAGNVKSD